MHKIDKNKILEFHYNEVKKKEVNKIKAHIETCEDCKFYLANIEDVELKLELWIDEEPSSSIINNVLRDITPESIEKPKEISVGFISPYLQMAFGLIFILLSIFLLKSNIDIFPLWQSVQNNWFVQIIGLFGSSFLVIIAIGSLITMLCLPFLIKQSTENNIG